LNGYSLFPESRQLQPGLRHSFFRKEFWAGVRINRYRPCHDVLYAPLGSLAVRCVLSNGLRGVFSRHPRPNPDSSYRELAIFILTFFGKLPRTPAMVAIAVTDGLLAVLFTFYLVEQ
jgi:hypothetical protein